MGNFNASSMLVGKEPSIPSMNGGYTKEKYFPKNDRYYEERRATAVSMALQLISDDVSGGDSKYDSLDYHLEHLSKYASQIEDALDREKDNS